MTPTPPDIPVVDIPGVRVRKDKRDHEFKLTPDEFTLRAEELALQHARVDLHADYAARVKKVLKTQGDELVAERGRLADVVGKRAEPREVSVDVFVDKSTGRIFFVMGLTETDGQLRGVVLHTAPANERDLKEEAAARQGNLFPLRIARPDEEGPLLPQVSDDLDDLDSNGVREITLLRFHGADPIRAIAALRNAFRSMTLREARAHIEAVQDGKQQSVGRLAGNALHSGLDMLKLSGLDVEAVEPGKADELRKTPDELFPELDTLGGAEIEGAVLAAMGNLSRANGETDAGYRARARRAGALRGFLAPAGATVTARWNTPDKATEAAVVDTVREAFDELAAASVPTAADRDALAEYRAMKAAKAVEGSVLHTVGSQYGVPMPAETSRPAADGCVIVTEIGAGRKEAVEAALRRIGWSRDNARGLMQRIGANDKPGGYVAFVRGDVSGLTDTFGASKAPKGDLRLEAVEADLTQAGAVVRVVLAKGEP